MRDEEAKTTPRATTEYVGRPNAYLIPQGVSCLASFMVTTAVKSTLGQEIVPLRLKIDCFVVADHASR